MSRRLILPLASAAFIMALVAGNSPSNGADVKKTRDEQVREDQKKVGADERWVYNDLDKGFAQAKRLKKPILLVFR